MCLGLVIQVRVSAQANTEEIPGADEAEADPAPAAPEKVDVEPLAEDRDIANRLRRILIATEWFRAPDVRVEEGVVFLTGQTANAEHREWAGKLANNTQDVVAVVNRIKVDVPSLFDFSKAYSELRQMGRGFVQSTPTLLASLLLLGATWVAAKLIAALANRVAGKRVKAPLLRDMIARATAIPVLLIGIYTALRVSGLTQLAATILGGTGVLGIILGIAFRDIAENFLASLLISVQRPFIAGDFVRINDHEGFVQSVTTRGTLLMTLDGNHVQIPNATIYKSIIENVTANPNVRETFVVGIDYGNSATEAQTAVLTVLQDHQAVLVDPEPLVLVEELGTSAVVLRVYFWVDGQAYSSLRVRSAVIRQVKLALQRGGFSLPDEAREMIFPNGVQVDLVQSADSSSSTRELREPSAEIQPKPKTGRVNSQTEDSSNAAEGNLESEQAEIQKQANESRILEEGPDLLADPEVTQPHLNPK